MADFSTPFANNAEKRLATTDEKQNGFPCGAASQPLFNGLFNQLWSELNAIHQAGGIAGSDNEVNTTLLNIQALIDAATGAGDTSQYVLFSQARTRLPIFPEFLTPDGKINVSAPATGTIRIPGGIDFMHRGIFIVSTIETDFLTDVSKTYHLRWNPVDGFALKDLSASTYNPSVHPESHVDFDSSFDDMLIARIITNSSNVATITNLVNKNRHSLDGFEIGPNGVYTGFQSNENIFGYETLDDGKVVVDLNFARKPESALNYVNNLYQGGDNDTSTNYNLGAYSPSRYSVHVWAQGDTNTTIGWRVWL